MSIGELLLTAGVAALVFSPKKIPMLATHIAIMIRKLNELKIDATALWEQQGRNLQLAENERKAKEADKTYLGTS